MSSSKKSLSIGMIVVFVCLLTLPTLVWQILPDSVRQEWLSTETLDEKRQPAEFPQTFDDDYLQQIEAYYNDRVPFRLQMISLEKRISQSYETWYRNRVLPVLTQWLHPNIQPVLPSLLPSVENPPETSDAHHFTLIRSQQANEDQYGYSLYRCSDCGAYQTRDIANKTVPHDYMVPQIDDQVLYGRRDWLFYNGDHNLDYYLGNNLLTEWEMAGWQTSFDTLNDICRQKGIRLLVMVAPNKEQVYPEYMPSYQLPDGMKRSDAILAYMQAHCRTSYLYPLPEMQAAKLYYDTYYKQDTHWNRIGGFVGAMAVYRALDMPVMDIRALDVTAIPHTGGDLSQFCGLSTAYSNFAVTYKPEISAQKADPASLGATVSGSGIVQWTSDSPNPAQMLLLGDSFRFAFEPYFSKDFSKATLAHRTDIGCETVKQSLQSLGEGDVLFLQAVERNDFANREIADQLISLLRSTSKGSLSSDSVPRT